MEDFEPASDIATFAPVTVGGSFEGGEVPPHDGRRSFDRQPFLLGQRALLVFEPLDDPFGPFGLCWPLSNPPLRIRLPSRR